MSDPQSAANEGGTASEETPMIPEELAPRQTAEDPVPNDPDATGADAPDAEDD